MTEPEALSDEPISDEELAQLIIHVRDGCERTPKFQYPRTTCVQPGTYMLVDPHLLAAVIARAAVLEAERDAAEETSRLTDQQLDYMRFKLAKAEAVIAAAREAVRHTRRFGEIEDALADYDATAPPTEEGK